MKSRRKLTYQPHYCPLCKDAPSFHKIEALAEHMKNQHQGVFNL